MKSLDQYVEQNYSIVRDCFTIVFDQDEYCDLSWMEPDERTEMGRKLNNGVAENLVALCFNTATGELVDSLGGILVDFSNYKAGMHYLTELALQIASENVAEYVLTERD